MSGAVGSWTVTEWRGFLSRMRQEMSSSLKVGETLQTLVRLVVPEHADWCSVELLNDRGEMETVAVAHSVREKTALLEQVRREYPADPESAVGPAAVARTGRAEFVADIPDSMLQQGARDERHLALLRELGFTSYICVPLVARDHVIGALTLVHVASGRRYEQADLDLATDIAEIAAINVDNARTFNRSEALQETLESVLDSALEAVIIMDADGLVVDWRKGSEQVFGWTRQEAIGRAVADLIIPEAYQQAHWEGLRRYLATGMGPVLGRRIEVEARGKDGRIFPVELAISAIHTESEVRFSAFLRDLTESRRAQQELLEAKNASEQANQAKSRFLANMSHELRTPLNAVIGYSEMLQEEAQEQGLGTLLLDLKRIKAAGDHLLVLINDVLDLSKIEAGKMDTYIERIELLPMLDQVAATIRPLVEGGGNRLELNFAEDLGWIASDVTKLRQIFFNLLSNAAKFTHDGVVRFSASRSREDNSLLVEVADTGIGIEPDQIQDLFEPFAQADASTTRKYGGTGLGLAITKRFTELLGADLAVDSAPGEGTRFRLSFKSGSGDERESEIRARAEERTPIVLVIDDDAAAQDLICRSLQKEGYSTVAASSGEEGIAMARALHPTAITLDVMMPEMDGWSVLGVLKADPDLCDIPVVMLTMVHEQNRAYSLGASDYLTKPIDRKRLVAVLDRYRCLGRVCDVLVVEDETASLDIIRAALSPRDWTVHEASNGQDALDLLRQISPDVVLLDLMMPHMDGFEFVERLRSDPSKQNLPVVVVTAKDLTREDRIRLNGHVEQIMSKESLTSGGLVRAIERALPDEFPAP